MIPLQAPINFYHFNFKPLLALLERGGPIVAIIGCLSVLALAVVLLKLFQFLRKRVGAQGLAEHALRDWFAGNRNNAFQRLARSRRSSAIVLHHAMSALHNGHPEAVIREDTERVALQELAELKRYFSILEATSQIAPLLGLFGTVIGMMSAFQTLQTSGAEADPAALAGGIWVALITTAVGLAVAIPTAFALYWFEGMVRREQTIIESTLTSLFTERLAKSARQDETQSSPAATQGEGLHAS
ncbi:MAG: MotA/TolQ/ExbB proton channel family protein [Pseudomonadota bacterium]